MASCWRHPGERARSSHQKTACRRALQLHLPEKIAAATLKHHGVTSRLHAFELELSFIRDFAPEIFAGLFIQESHGQSLRYSLRALKQYGAADASESGAVIRIQLDIARQINFAVPASIGAFVIDTLRTRHLDYVVARRQIGDIDHARFNR